MPAKLVKNGKNAPAKNGGARQLLGMKGASDTDNIWAIRLQLTKPVTWVPLIWGVLCGAAASGEFTWTAENVAKSLLCMTMSGPLLTGYTQARTRAVCLFLAHVQPLRCLCHMRARDAALRRRAWYIPLRT